MFLFLLESDLCYVFFPCETLWRSQQTLSSSSNKLEKNPLCYFLDAPTSLHWIDIVFFFQKPNRDLVEPPKFYLRVFITSFEPFTCFPFIFMVSPGPPVDQCTVVVRWVLTLCSLTKPNLVITLYIPSQYYNITAHKLNLVITTHPAQFQLAISVCAQICTNS